MRRFVPFLFLALMLNLLSCGGGGEDENIGATVSLIWDPVNHESAITYTVHYGSQSAGNVGACNYEQSRDVSEPFVTITGLDFDTIYHFAVSAYTNEGGLRSDCSNEVHQRTEKQKQHEPKEHENKQHEPKEHENKQHRDKHA